MTNLSAMGGRPHSPCDFDVLVEQDILTKRWFQKIKKDQGADQCTLPVWHSCSQLDHNHKHPRQLFLFAIFLNLFLIWRKEFLGGTAAVRIRLFPDCKTAEERGTTELKVEQIASWTNLSMSQATMVITWHGWKSTSCSGHNIWNRRPSVRPSVREFGR